MIKQSPTNSQKPDSTQHRGAKSKLRTSTIYPCTLFYLSNLPSIIPLQLCSPFRSPSCAHPSAAAVRGPVWCGDVARSLIPTLWEMRLSCSPSCSCNFDQALMWLGSDPDMTGPATWKRSSEGKWGWWSVLIWPVNPEKKGIILKVSFFCCCSALWVIKVSCIRFSLANIAIYNDLTFLF